MSVALIMPSPFVPPAVSPAAYRPGIGEPSLSTTSRLWLTLGPQKIPPRSAPVAAP
jgi:hypothetical protein